MRLRADAVGVDLRGSTLRKSLMTASLLVTLRAASGKFMKYTSTPSLAQGVNAIQQCRPRKADESHLQASSTTPIKASRVWSQYISIEPESSTSKTVSNRFRLAI
jgi:hypothetical protein